MPQALRYPRGVPDARPTPARRPRVAVASLGGAASGDLLPLTDAEARHATAVRRLGQGDAVTALDPAGRTAGAELSHGPGGWGVRLTSAPLDPPDRPRLAVYAAVPKGARADWMAEKLCELGVARWTPLLTRRSAVSPGANKVQRWRRLAAEAAKQSGSPPTAIDDPTSLADALAGCGSSPTVLTTERDAPPFAAAESAWVGPEGGWDDAELAAFDAVGARYATLGESVLRVETAALAAAVVARVRSARRA